MSHQASVEISCCLYSRHSQRFFLESSKIEEIGIVVTKEHSKRDFYVFEIKTLKTLSRFDIF